MRINDIRGQIERTYADFLKNDRLRIWCNCTELRFDPKLTLFPDDGDFLKSLGYYRTTENRWKLDTTDVTDLCSECGGEEPIDELINSMCGGCAHYEYAGW